RRRAGQRQMPVARRGAKQYRRQPHHRSNRQIDPAGDDDRRQRERQQPELHAEAHHLEEIGGREEVLRNRGEHRDLREDGDQQDALLIERRDHEANLATKPRNHETTKRLPRRHERTKKTSGSTRSGLRSRPPSQASKTGWMSKRRDATFVRPA